MRAYRTRRKGAPQVPPMEVVEDHAERFIEWAESTLVVPTGLLAGKPFQVYEFQRQFVRAAMAEGIRAAALFCPRKLGKSGLVAALVLYFLVGPGNSPNWRGVVVSLDGGLARELRENIELTAEASGLGGLISVFKSPQPGRIEGMRGARLTALASTRATGHGISCDLCIIDEAGLLQENHRNLWNAVESSVSARDGRLWCISIRGDGPMFSELADRAFGDKDEGVEPDPSVRFIEYRADADARIDDEEQWYRANPALGAIKSLSYMKDAARKAMSSPSDAAFFRAIELNLPGSLERSRIVSMTDLQASMFHEDDLPPREGPVVIGFDAGGSSSMTALVALWPQTMRAEIYGAFPADPPLDQRGEQDGVGSGFYSRMRDRGELEVYPGRSTPAKPFIQACIHRLEGQKVLAIGSDRHRHEEVNDVLNANGITWPRVWRGIGRGQTADGSSDITSFQRFILDGELRIRESMMLAHAVRESEVDYDELGNGRLDKSRMRGRIDALQAAVIACGLAARVRSKPMARKRRVMSASARW